MISSASVLHDKGPTMVKAHSANFVQYLGTGSCGHEPDHKPGLHSARVELE